MIPKYENFLNERNFAWGIEGKFSWNFTKIYFPSSHRILKYTSLSQIFHKFVSLMLKTFHCNLSVLRKVLSCVCSIQHSLLKNVLLHKLPFISEWNQANPHWKNKKWRFGRKTANKGFEWFSLFGETSLLMITVL
jgi:hypothetical protein